MLAKTIAYNSQNYAGTLGSGLLFILSLQLANAMRTLKGEHWPDGPGNCFIVNIRGNEVVKYSYRGVGSCS